MSNNSCFKNDCLKGKNILISGSLGALGKIITEKLLHHGATVFMSDIIPENKLNFDLRSDSYYYYCDVSNEESVVSLYKNIKKNHGTHPDIVLCHAGIAQDFPLENYSTEDWEKIYDINVKGSFLLSREGLKQMLGKQTFDNPGKIIYTSSWVAQVPWPQLSGYNSSKAAIEMLMKTAAREYAPKHIRINAIAPGQVDSGMAKKQFETDEIYRERTKRSIPVGFMQPSESVADAFLFLCSSASNYMTGSTLLVDGGNSLYPMI